MKVIELFIDKLREWEHSDFQSGTIFIYFPDRIALDFYFHSFHEPSGKDRKPAVTLRLALPEGSRYMPADTGPRYMLGELSGPRRTMVLSRGKRQITFIIPSHAKPRNPQQSF